MKKTMLIAAGLLIGLAANAQKLKESEVPAPVKEAFKKSYKDAREVKWEKEGANFEAGFESGKTEQSVVFDAAGELLRIEGEVAVHALPTAARGREGVREG